MTFTLLFKIFGWRILTIHVWWLCQFQRLLLLFDGIYWSNLIKRFFLYVIKFHLVRFTSYGTLNTVNGTIHIDNFVVHWIVWLCFCKLIHFITFDLICYIVFRLIFRGNDFLIHYVYVCLFTSFFSFFVNFKFFKISGKTFMLLTVFLIKASFEIVSKFWNKLVSVFFCYLVFQLFYIFSLLRNHKI
jgi:hypothetical protein